GSISREIKPEENDDALNFRKAAKDALVVAIHPSLTGVTNLTTEQLKGIYSGSVTNWKQLGGPDAEILLLDRPEDESAKRLLREHYLGQDLPNSPNAIVLRKEGELIETLKNTPNSIGAFSLAYAISHNLSVNRLKLNGIAPKPENLKTGNYPMARTIGIVWSKNVSEATQAFVNYIFSQPGTSALEKSGFAAL
ncbi:MAG: phosphate ABC transporter substrate-binding protein, partial [Okeania sp. SIO2D1]|nr:phosphate ABC transporter substrate-binding protein [Okeania sp. SIO2D1]